MSVIDELLSYWNLEDADQARSIKALVLIKALLRL
jgi:hypothetical protein